MTLLIHVLAVLTLYVSFIVATSDLPIVDLGYVSSSSRRRRQTAANEPIGTSPGKQYKRKTRFQQ